MSLAFGLGLGQDQDVHCVARYAQLAEELGYHHVTMIDMGTLSQEVHVMMTLAAAATSRIQVGHGVTNPRDLSPGGHRERRGFAARTLRRSRLRWDRGRRALRSVPHPGRADARAA